MTSKEVTRQAVDTLRAVEGWLRADDVARFSDFNVRRMGHPASLRAQILMKRLPDSWDQYSRLRNIMRAEKSFKDKEAQQTNVLSLKVGRAALESAALSRTAFILAGVVQGASLEKSRHVSWSVSKAFREGIAKTGFPLPSNYILEMSIDQAVGSYLSQLGPSTELTARTYGSAIKGTYIAGLGLAASALLDQDVSTGLVLPNPTSQVAELWEYDQDEHYKATTEVITVAR